MTKKMRFEDMTFEEQEALYLFNKMKGTLPTDQIKKTMIRTINGYPNHIQLPDEMVCQSFVEWQREMIDKERERLKEREKSKERKSVIDKFKINDEHAAIKVEVAKLIERVDKLNDAIKADNPNGVQRTSKAFRRIPSIMIIV